MLQLRAGWASCCCMRDRVGVSLPTSSVSWRVQTAPAQMQMQELQARRLQLRLALRSLFCSTWRSSVVLPARHTTAWGGSAERGALRQEEQPVPRRPTASLATPPAALLPTCAQEAAEHRDRHGSRLAVPARGGGNISWRASSAVAAAAAVEGRWWR